MSLSDGPGRMPGWGDVLARAGHAEEIGLDSVWVCDHFLSNPPGAPTEGIMEAWTIVAALAATTTRVELGQLVTCVSFRNPALLAKMAATADAISGGRLILGLGPGGDDAECAVFGYPTDHRVARLEEALQIIGPLLRGDRVTFEGRYHGVRDALLLPLPDRRIPIMIAAEGPRMLALTARYADAWNTAWYGAPNHQLDQRMADLDAALRAEGRDRASIRRFVCMDIVDPGAIRLDDGEDDVFRGSVDEMARTIDAYEELGFDDLIILLRPNTDRSLDRVAEALELRIRG